MQFIKEIQNLPPFTFDDIVLQPQYSEVESRLDSRLNTTSKIKDIVYHAPIVSANMDCVSGPEMLMAMDKCGGLGILHRFFSSPEDRKAALNKLYGFSYGVAVGISHTEQEFIDKNRHLIPYICVDIAHANNKKCIEFVQWIRKNFAIPVIVGNVATYDGAKRYVDIGVECIKVGIGNGSCCTTRMITGHGVSQGSAILDCYAATKGSYTKLIADGGIRKPADFVKSLALGADFVMLGKILAGADESAAKLSSTHLDHKIYRGQSSHELQRDAGIYRKGITPEGVQTLVPCSGPVVNTIDHYMGGLRSAMSYTGAFTLAEFREKAKILFINHNSYIEGTPHGLNQ